MAQFKIRTPKFTRNRSKISWFLRKQRLDRQSGYVDPVPDFLVHYRLDGTDSSLTPVNGEDFRIAPECPSAIGAWFNNNNYYDADADIGIINSIGSGDFSVACFINTAVMKFATVVNMDGEGIGSDSFRFTPLGNGTVAFRLDGINHNTIANVSDGKWHHICYTIKSGGNINAYVDGILDDTFVSPAYNISGRTQLAIGASISGGNKLDGGLDGFRLYDRVLTPTEITTLANNTCDFNPSQITTQAWYDATDVDSIIEASGRVSQWDDKSSNGNHVSQGTGTKQPLTGSVSLNGLNTINFDGSNDSLKYSGAIGLASATPAFTVLSVVQKTSKGTSADCLASFGSTTNLTSGKMVGYHLGDTSFRFNDGFAIFDDSSFTTPNPALVAFGSTATGDYVSGKFSRLNGEAQTLDVTSGGTYALDDEHFMLGARVTSTGSQSTYLDGYIGEVVMIPTDDLATIQKLEGYLAWKWGLVDILDVSHPYKLESPKEA